MIEQIAEKTFQKLMPSGDTIEIGDKDSIDFKPFLKLNRWGGECFIKIGLPVTDRSVPIIDGDKITWEGRDRHIIMYPLAPTEQFELGGYEYEIVLEKKPASNKIVLNIQSQGLKFDYQPALTQEEIDESHKRPDNIVGSYAVYHATKGGIVSSRGKDYKAGKAFHIPRPRIVDSRGDWVWGELFIGGGKQIITIPWDFLNSAVYPIRHVAGDTFGYTTAGGSSFELLNCAAMGGSTFIYAASTGDIITKFSIYASSPSAGSFDMAAYSISGVIPDSRLAVGVTIDIGTPSDWFHSDTVSQGMSNGVSYCAAFGNDGPSAELVFYDIGTGDNRSGDLTTGALPASWTHNDWSAAKYSIYCTYTPAPEGQPYISRVQGVQGMRSYGGF